MSMQTFKEVKYLGGVIKDMMKLGQIGDSFDIKLTFVFNITTHWGPQNTVMIKSCFMFVLQVLSTEKSVKMLTMIEIFV